MGLIGRALALLVMLAFTCIAALWAFADAHPWLAAVVFPLIAWRVVVLERRDRAVVDARMRDEHVPSMSPTEYEQFVARLLIAAGWISTHRGQTGDQGCDVLAELRGFRAVVQVKHYRGRCGNQAVQEAVGARLHYSAQIMVVVAPNGFTRAAVELARSNGVHLLHHSALGTLERVARIP
jgi:restriction system protein